MVPNIASAWADRLNSKIQPEPMSGCWIWTGAKSRGYSYARDMRTKKQDLAHRIIYELLVGQIPVGLQIDHLCRNRSCVNPKHLEAVTAQTNIRRSPNGTRGKWARSATCPRGHVRAPGPQGCQACRRLFKGKKRT